MNRRDILSLLAAAPLAACGGVAAVSPAPVAPVPPNGPVAPPDGSLSKIIDYANLVLNGLSSFSAFLPASAANLLVQARDIVAQISGLSSSGGAGALIQQLARLGNSILNALPIGVLPAPVMAIVAAVNTMLPVILTLVGVSQPMARSRRLARVKPVSELQAVATLRRLRGG